MIHDEICTFEVCKLAKEKGFDVPTAKNYRHENGATCNAPTQSLLQRWLREEKGITICVDIYDDGWFYDISTFYKQDTGVYEVDIPYKSSNVTPVHGTYELALEDALKYALENLI